MKPANFDIQAIRAAWESISAMLLEEIAADQGESVNDTLNPSRSSAKLKPALAYSTPEKFARP